MSIEAIKEAMEGVAPDRLQYEADAMYAAVQGEEYGDTFHAFNWADKPHRVLYDAINLIRDSASEIDRLQRENEALREDRYKLACAITGGEDAPGLLDSTPTSEIVEIAQHARRMHQDDIDRAMAAESEVERLQTELALSKPLYSRRQIEARVKLLEEALAPFAKIASDGWGSSLPDDAPLAIVNANMPDLPQWLQKVRGVVTQGDCRRARTTLASTGGEHHGN